MAEQFSRRPYMEVGEQNGRYETIRTARNIIRRL